MYKLLFLILTSLILQKNVINNNQKFTGKVILLTTINPTDKDSLFDAYDICVASSGDIYITDQSEDCINKFGKHGTNNGEFNSIGEIFISKSYIAVSDNKSTRLQVFTRGFKYLRTIYTQGLIFDLAFDADENLLVAAYTGKKQKSLFKYSRESNKIIQIIPLKFSTGDQFKDLYFLSISNNSDLIIAYRVLNRIEIWNKLGQFMKDFQIPKLKDETDYDNISTGIFSKTKVPKETMISHCSIDSSGYIYILSGSYTENQLRDLYIFNINGEYITKITMPNKIWKVFASGKKIFYTVEGKRNIIKKYSLN